MKIWSFLEILTPWGIAVEEDAVLFYGRRQLLRTVQNMFGFPDRIHHSLCSVLVLVRGRKSIKG